MYKVCPIIYVEIRRENVKLSKLRPFIWNEWGLHEANVRCRGRSMKTWHDQVNQTLQSDHVKSENNRRL